MKDILKLSLVLFLICAIVAGVLGAVDMVTRGPIEKYQTDKTNEAYAKVMPVNVAEGEEKYSPIDLKALGLQTNVDANGQKIKILSVSKANDGSGYVVETEFSGAQGTITMVVGVNEALKCTGVSITKHSETSGLGANAASTAEVGVNFRQQFVGVTKLVQLKKAGGTIDALSGATITSRSVTNATAAAISFVETLQPLL
ncbi:MAG: RnfABCDGE type electron transport complex subunit G [Oscillospiraceae bacterium]|nr:RnfABCDGE type electron transport complex subunit G [Oscillospiraceae bacterium]